MAVGRRYIEASTSHHDSVGGPDFYTDRGDAIPRRPNRHASAHAVHPDQYNPVNAIKFLMLATAMLADMEYDGWARILAETAA